MRDYSAQNLWRMRQFFETYRDQPKLSALLRELSVVSYQHCRFSQGLGFPGRGLTAEYVSHSFNDQT